MLVERLGVPRWAIRHAGSAADAALAGGLFAAAMFTLAAAEPGVFSTRDPDAFAYVLGALLTLPLAVRRRWPLPVFAIGLASLVAFEARDYSGVNVDFVGPVVALYTVAALTPRRVSLAAVLVTIIVVLLAAPAEEEAAGNALAVVLIVGGVWLLGDSARSRRLSAEQLAAQNEALRTARLELADQAVGQERLRIARELHDVVAHHMSAIVVQSALAQDRLESDPAAAKRALAQVEDVSRNALREMRQILGVMRQAGDDQGALAPSPSIGDLEQLCERAREAGLSVRAAVSGNAPPLPPAVELAAYRVVQEALTNVVKHAPGAHVDVRLDYTPRDLRIEVSDDGASNEQESTRAPTGGGQGLIGMRERVSLLHGSFEAGPRAGGGFRVTATLPLERAS
jgi:signal transduction histidine kinase